MLSAEPWCRTCIAADNVTRDSIATVLDHVTPLAEGGSNEDDNLQPLCTHCHDLKTAREAARARGVTEPTTITHRPTIGLDGWPV